MSKMTGGTARMLSRRPTPASQSKLTATQNSRMALPAATYSALVKHASATQSVDSPPPCGEGLGVGVVVVARVAFNNFDPHPARLRYASAGDPPHKGEGRDRVRRSRRTLQHYRPPQPSPTSGEGAARACRLRSLHCSGM